MARDWVSVGGRVVDIDPTVGPRYVIELRRRASVLTNAPRRGYGRVASGFPGSYRLAAIVIVWDRLAPREMFSPAGQQGEIVDRIIIPYRSDWDPEAINIMGGKGASCDVYSEEDVLAALDELVLDYPGFHRPHFIGGDSFSPYVPTPK